MILPLQSTISIRFGISTLLVLTAMCAQAATLTWDGGGSDNNWGTAANWNPNTTPTGSDAVTFAGTTRLTIADSWSGSLTSMTFASGAGAFVIGGAGHDLGSGGITNNSSQNQTLNSQYSLTANQTWTNTASDGALLVGGPVYANNRTLTLAGSGSTTFTNTLNVETMHVTGGTVTLSGSASKSIEHTIVENGHLIMAQTGGAAINGDLTVGNGGVVSFAGSNQTPTWINVTLEEGSTLLLGNTSQTFAGLEITGDSVIDFGTGGSQLNVTYDNITIANGVTITIKNWNGGDVFAGANPGNNVVNIEYADNNGNVYATGSWGGGIITPVPEPSTYGLLMLGSGGAFVLFRRRPRPSR